MAAKVEMVEEGNETREYVFYEEFVPLDLQEEEVVAETADSQEVVIEEAESEEIVHATNSILPEGYDVVEEQWSGQEVIVESTDGGETTYAVKVEPASEEPEEETTTIVGSQDHVYECYKCAKRFNLKEKLYKHMKLHNARGDDVMIERDGKRIWTCTQCDKTFISRKGSIIHQRTHTGERPYSCSVCQKRFIDSSTLMKHQVIHQAVRPFSCLICRRGFNQKVALQRHEKTHGQVQPSYKCKFCPKTFLVGSSLQAHEKIHSGIKPYTCQYCPSRFHTSTAQRQHERVHTNERPYRCSYCPKAFKDSGTLFKHQVIHSGIRPFVCPICSQGFTQKVALRKHIRSHVSRNQDNVCEVCDAQYFSKDDLCTHIEEHFVQHPSLTQVKIIATSSLRNKHELMNSTDSAESPPGQGSKSPQGERGQSDLSDLATLCDVAISTAGDLANNFPCLHCGMNFRRKKSLDAHLAIHRMSCRFCDRTFPDKQSLENHERRLCLNNASGNARPVYETSSQNSSSPNVAVSNSLVGSNVANNNNQTGKHAKRFFYCERCDKTFSSRNGYIIHQRSHTGERPYPCRWCEKAFGDSATRHKHERIHTGERPFKCARCPRAFNQRAALRAHQVTHTVDRAFLCKYCPSSFPYYATLKRHQQSCHASMSCPLCGMSAPDNKLYQHVQTKHASESDLACSLCDSGVFAEVEEFTEHIIWHAKQSVMTTDKTPSEVNMSDHVVNHEIIETTEDDTQPNTVVETAIVTVSRQTKTGEETRRIPITVHNIKEEIVEEEEVIEEYTEEIEGLGETEEYIEEAYAEENYDDTSGGGVEQMVEEEAEQVSHTEEIYEEEVEDDGVLEQQLMELGQDVEIEAEIETETVEEEEEMEIESCNQLIVPKEEIIEQTIVTDEFTIVEEAYTCEICGSFFQDPQDLNDHMAAHEDE